MKIISLFTVLLISTLSYSQAEENEIKRVAELRNRYDLMEQVRVFPNPSSTDRISIQAPPGSKCEIYDLNGQLIESNQTSDGVIQFNSLQTGMYIARIQKDHMVRTEKFVIL